MPEGVKISITAETAAAAKSVQDFFGILEKGLEAISGAGAFLSRLGEQIAAAFTVEKIVQFTARAIEAEAALGKLAKSTGLSVETLSALKSAYIDAGGESDEFNRKIQTFTQRVGLAYRQGGDMAKVFRDMRVTITDAVGNLLPMEDILQRVAAKFAATSDEARRADWGRELFGLDYHEIVDTLTEVGAAFDALKAKAASQGTLIHKENAEQARLFLVTIRELHEQFNSLFTELGNDMLPALRSLIDFLKEDAKDVGGLTDTIKLLAQWVKGVIVTILAFYEALKTLGEFIGRGLEAEWEIGTGAVKTFWEVLKHMADALPAIKQALLNFGDALIHLAKAAADYEVLNFKGAASEAKAAFNETADAGKKAGAAIGESFKAAGSDITGWWMRSGDTLASFTATFIADVKKQWGDWWKTSLDMFDKVPPKAAPPKPATPGAPAAGSDTDQRSEEVRQLIEEIDKQYAKSTQGRLALLAIEEAAEKKKLDDLVGYSSLTAAKAEEEKTKITEIYARQRAEIELANAKERAGMALEQLKNQEEMVNKNPDLTTGEKQQNLLKIYEAQLDTLRQQAAAADKMARTTSNPDQQLAAQKEAVALYDQIDDKQRELNQLVAQNNPFEMMRQSLVKLMNEWGTAAQQMAQVIKGSVETSVNSLSSGLTKGIVGTERWAKVWKQMGISIESEVVGAIIKMFVQLTVGQMMQHTLALALKAMGLAETAPVAAATSAMWAPSATLATISTMGGAAAAARALGMERALEGGSPSLAELNASNGK